MPAKSALPTFEFGGVDSRSNPLALPANRSLRCRNWVPKDSGILELRSGYSTVSVSTTTATAIHSIVPFRQYDDTKYVIIGQGSGTPKVIAVATGTLSTPTVKGTAFSSSAKASYYIANNKLHYCNGTDQKVYDGTYWRDNGIRQVSDADIASVIIAEGVRELTSAEGAAVTLGTSGAAGLATSSLGGYGIHVALFDTATNELGPATFRVSASQARVAVASGPKQVDIGGMPTPATSTWVKLIARTEDGGSRAYFVTTAASLTGVSLARSGSTGTFTKTTHGLSTGDCILISGATDTKWNKVWSITVTDANTFTVTLSGGDVAANFSTSESGLTASKILKAANATATATINTSTTDTSYIVNQDLGLAATVITTSSGGYQFYAAIYNRSTGQVGNRRAFGSRITQTGYRFNVRITGLPDYSGTDSEWDILIGRTGDGGAVPYAVSDGTNWIYANNADTKITITQASIDGTAELPTRNGVIPSGINKVALVDKKVYANADNSPYIYKSGSLADDINSVGTGGRAIQVGRPEQSFSANDLETFPTAESVTALASYEYPDSDGSFAGCVAWSLRNCAVFVERVRYGVIEAAWRGPWAVGCAGKRAFAKTPYGLFWLTGDKQLATFTNGNPIGVSGEYEVALLAKIGDAYLTTAEVDYINIPSLGIDQLRIECQDSNGVPFSVIHDFKLSGQGYEQLYLGPLATSYTSAQVLDSNGKQQIWASPASGAGIGQLYLLNSGATDAGTEFTADYIGILNTGGFGASIPEIHRVGDQNITFWFGESLSTTLDTLTDTDFQQITPTYGARAVPNEDGNFQFFDELPKPLTHYCYLRFKLTSHSADGDLTLNTVPHIPLEDYGRMYSVIIGTGQKG